MSKRTKVFLAVAVVAVAVAVPVSFLPAGASAGACGSTCVSPLVQLPGTGSTSSAQGWPPEHEGDVSGAVQAGVLAEMVNMQYSQDEDPEAGTIVPGICANLNWEERLSKLAGRGSSKSCGLFSLVKVQRGRESRVRVGALGNAAGLLREAGYSGYAE
jgi:hypothetical protein